MTIVSSLYLKLYNVQTLSIDERASLRVLSNLCVNVRKQWQTVFVVLRGFCNKINN